MYSLLKIVKSYVKQGNFFNSLKLIDYMKVQACSPSRRVCISQRTHITCLFLTVATCCSKSKEQKFDSQSLTHSFLLKQASNVTVNAATQLITLTVEAIMDVNINYRTSLDKLIGLIEVAIETAGVPSYQDEIWDDIIAARAEIDDLKKTLLELTSLLEYVEKTATSAAETAFLSGAEYASTVMCERINSAHQQVQIDREKTRILEEELLKIQQSHVYATAKAEKKKSKEQQPSNKN